MAVAFLVSVGGPYSIANRVAWQASGPGFAYKSTSARAKPHSGRVHNASSRPFVRLAQQRQQAAACRRAQEVGDGDQQRERHAGIEAEKGHGDDLEVLQRENDRRGGKQNDDGEVESNAWGLLFVLQERGARSPNYTFSDRGAD
jgi:hypothetical protein